MESKTVKKYVKARILEAYFERSISKVEMKFLMIEGIHIPPTDWVYSTESEKSEKEKKRELISKVFGYSFPKVEWV